MIEQPPGKSKPISNVLNTLLELQGSQGHTLSYDCSVSSPTKNKQIVSSACVHKHNSAYGGMHKLETKNNYEVAGFTRTGSPRWVARWMPLTLLSLAVQTSLIRIQCFGAEKRLLASKSFKHRVLPKIRFMTHAYILTYVNGAQLQVGRTEKQRILYIFIASSGPHLH